MDNNLSGVGSVPSQRLHYPKRVFLILGNEFCERFMFYGLDTILALYLRDKLGFSENDATILYHSFTMMVYFMCIFGGLISDVWLGKYRTIFYISMIYVVGSIVVSVSAIPTINLSAKAILIVGLLLISIGSGGIKPCVPAFGGDQFKLPEQAAHLATFFSVFYFSVYLGAFISTSLTPILRADVQCFGQNDCYSLAFAVPAVLMIFAIVLFVLGKSSYTYVKTSSENMLVQVSKCVWHAIKTKYRERRTNQRKNLLDYSIDKYGVELVNDIRSIMRIGLLYLPLPLYWTLFMQKGSRWIFQADKMNGDIGIYIIKPDQMQMVNKFLLLILIPLFECVVYPILNKLGVGRMLQRMTAGGVLTAVSFLLSAILQFKIDASPPHSVHMFWQLPQILALTTGEVLFSPIGLAFSYEESPKNMRSIALAFWLFTNSLGNLITVLLVPSLTVFDSIAYEFLFFSGLMFIDMIIFAILAFNYKSRAQTNVNTVNKDTVE